MRFFDRTFFPRIQAEGITTIIHLGDFLDRRKFVNFLTLNAVQKLFVNRLHDSGAEMHCILGNHDIFYKNRSDVNSLKELFDDKFTVHEKPITLPFDGLNIALLPWINKENEEESLRFIQKTDAPVLCGHLELHGFQVLRNTPFDGGMNAELFKKFHSVYTGHFHTRHSRGNIHYLGCPYEITMGDYGDKKGFHILDTETRELEFVKNPHNIFTQIEWDDSSLEESKIVKVDPERTCGKFVRIVVKKKTKPYIFEKFVDSVYANSPHAVTIVEDLQPEAAEDEDIDLSEDTLSIINREIEGMQNVGDHSRLKSLMRDLYTESVANESTRS